MIQVQGNIPQRSTGGAAAPATKATSMVKCGNSSEMRLLRDEIAHHFASSCGIGRQTPYADIAIAQSMLTDPVEWPPHTTRESEVGCQDAENENQREILEWSICSWKDKLRLFSMNLKLHGEFLEFRLKILNEECQILNTSTYGRQIKSAWHYVTPDFSSFSIDNKIEELFRTIEFHKSWTSALTKRHENSTTTVTCAEDVNINFFLGLR